MRSPAQELKKTNSQIENILNQSNFERGFVAQNIVGSLRNLVEHVLVYAKFGDNVPHERYYDAIQDAVLWAKQNSQLRFAWDFHYLLQKVVSHYTPSETSSERLLLKYMEPLYLLRDYVADVLNLSILSNLEAFPLEQDTSLQVYYSQIATVIDTLIENGATSSFLNERFYISSSKPFFVDEKVYYEISFLPALDGLSKFNKVLAFSRRRIPSNYSIQLAMLNIPADICGVNLPVAIILDWAPSIRPCEINSLLKLFGEKQHIQGRYRSYVSLMTLIKETRLTLNELCELPDLDYARCIAKLEPSEGNTAIEVLLDRSRTVLLNNKKGANVLRYLLFRPRNRVIKSQLQDRPNNWLGNMYLDNKCLPFDEHPFSSSLPNHVVSFFDVVRCIDPTGREPDVFARHISDFSENSGKIYIDEKEFTSVSNIDDLVCDYNSTLYGGHSDRELVHENGQVFLRGNENNIVKIITNLLCYSSRGICGYVSTLDSWLQLNPDMVDDPKKLQILKTLFKDTRVGLIYGSAGTGKSTLVNYVCSVLDDIRKCAIATTNPAVDNLRRRVKSESCEFMTIAKFLNSDISYELLIIDECSTVSNRDMARILASKRFDAILLIGDTRQIEAINLGNWFSLIRDFMPKYCVHDLTYQWRTTSDYLLSLWDAVREIKPEILEIMEANDVTSDINSTIFESSSDDEIILCLNYEGIYGINNINRIAQSQNINEAIRWGVHTYKVGDPVLFNESNRFAPLLFNNLKGEIVAIKKHGNKSVDFTIGVERQMHELSVNAYEGLDYLGSNNGLSLVRFSVVAMVDQDDEGALINVVPFQVSYAASMHKAQGLEYDSVKIIITKNVEERISHNIFYTAITRARKQLRIYWTPETESHVIKSLAHQSNNKDACLLANRHNLILHP